MVKDFQRDLEQAHSAEQLVREVFSSRSSFYSFEDVSDQRQYFKKGDIKAVGIDGKEIMIEVKDDSRIAETKNILCEEEVYYLDGGFSVPGNFYSDYEIYCVVSRQERKIYVMNFRKLKEIYKKGQYQEIKHYDQITYCYLLPLSTARKYGALIEEVRF